MESILVPGIISIPLLEFITNQNQTIQDDPVKATQAFCEKIEELVFNAIKSHTHTIAPGVIKLVVSGAAATNPSPLVLVNQDIN